MVTSSDFQLPGPLVLADSSSDEDETSGTSGESALIRPDYGPNGTYETEDQYIERIKAQALDLALPSVETTNATGQQVASGLLVDPTDVYQPLNDNPWQLSTVSTFDVGDDNLGVDTAASIPTDWVGEVFVSKDYMYLLRTDYQGRNTKTEILKYDLNTSSLVAEGSVPGYIDTQFSVDEHDGFLRMSTTKGFGNRSTNNVYVLEQKQSSLDIVGKVEDLAPGERIYSTRFQGDYGFVVTFREVDPLYTLDLSDPKKPHVLGELKIPGFSEYLQVIPDGERTLLLSVGQDADPETGEVGSLKVSLFDVTDLENPTEIDNYIFEGDFTYSEALWDHLAITGADVLRGGKAEDDLYGGAGRDRLYGGADADMLTGNGGGDRFVFKKALHSLLRAYDTILDLDIDKDNIKGAYQVAASEVEQLGSVDDLQPKTIRTLLKKSDLVAKGAATFTFGDETFLALNDDVAGFQAQTDTIIKITGYTGPLENLQIV